MKTIKTVNGLKKIDTVDAALLPFQVRLILQEHRATLVHKILAGGVVAYIDYKFRAKLSFKQVEKITSGLEELKASGIDYDTYRSIFDSVQNNDFTNLDNKLFYTEIDSVIKSILFEPQLFNGISREYLH